MTTFVDGQTVITADWLNNVDTKLTGLSINVKAFGAKGDGVTDDTAAIQNAINYVFALGGGKISLSEGRYLISSANLYVRAGVTLDGGWESPGMPLPYTNATLSGLKGTIVLSSSYSIVLSGLAGELSGSSALRGLYILRSGLTLPSNTTEATAAVAAFAGTAIILGAAAGNYGYDCYVGHCMILGFAQAISGSYCARYTIEFVKGDCTAGIYTTQVWDIGRIRHCHFWPFVTVNFSGAQSIRTGVAYNFDTGNDWSTCIDSFSFAYNIGFRSAANSVRFTNCGADGNTTLATTSGSIGFYAAAGSTDTKFIGCDSANHEAKFRSDTTDKCALIGCSGWSSTAYGVYASAGTCIVNSCYFYGTITTACVYVGASIGWATISDTLFNITGTVFSIDSASTYKISITDTNTYLGTPSGLTADTNKSVYPFTDLGNSRYVIGGATNGYIDRYALSSGSTSTPALTPVSTIGSQRYSAYTGSAWNTVSQIRHQVVGTPSATNLNTNIVLAATPLNSVSSVDSWSVGDGTTTVPFRPTADNASSLGTSAYRVSTVYAATGTINTSDSRLKTDVADSTLGLSFINALRPVSYKWKEGQKTVVSQKYVNAAGEEVPESDPSAVTTELVTDSVPGTRTHWGFIAQDVKSVVDSTGVDFAGWTLADPDDPDSIQSLRYTEFIAPLVKAVQELTARVKALEAK